MKKYRLACTDCDYVRETDDLASAIRQHLETCQRCDEGFILLDNPTCGCGLPCPYLPDIDRYALFCKTCSDEMEIIEGIDYELRCVRAQYLHAARVLKDVLKELEG